MRSGEELTLEGVDDMLLVYISKSFRAYRGIGAGRKRGGGAPPSGVASGNIFCFCGRGSDIGELKACFLMPIDRSVGLWIAGSLVLNVGARRRPG
jgi:hypothetical protein